MGAGFLQQRSADKLRLIFAAKGTFAFSRGLERIDHEGKILMKKIIAMASATILAFGVAACDGANEEAMEEAGDLNTEIVEDQADTMEDAGAITDTQEDAMVENAEDQADVMEAQGEAMDNGAMAPAPAPAQ